MSKHAGNRSGISKIVRQSGCETPRLVPPRPSCMGMQRPGLPHHASPDPSPHTDRGQTVLRRRESRVPNLGENREETVLRFGELREDGCFQHCRASSHTLAIVIGHSPRQLPTAQSARPGDGAKRLLAMARLSAARSTSDSHSTDSVSSPLPEMKIPCEDTYMPSLHAGSAWRNAITLQGTTQGRERDRARAAAHRLRATTGRRRQRRGSEAERRSRRATRSLHTVTIKSRPVS